MVTDGGDQRVAQRRGPDLHAYAIADHSQDATLCRRVRTVLQILGDVPASIRAYSLATR